MKTSTDQERAQHYLVHRAKGYSISHILRRTKWRYTVLVTFLVAATVGFLASDSRSAKGFCLWAIGMFLGAVVRDLAWLRQLKGNWRFVERVTDWKKIEELAGK